MRKQIQDSPAAQLLGTRRYKQQRQLASGSGPSSQRWNRKHWPCHWHHLQNRGKATPQCRRQKLNKQRKKWQEGGVSWMVEGRCILLRNHSGIKVLRRPAMKKMLCCHGGGGASSAAQLDAGKANWDIASELDLLHVNSEYTILKIACERQKQRIIL